MTRPSAALDTRSLGQILKLGRVQRRLTVRDAARQAEMTSPQWSRLEAGEGDIRVSTLARALSVFGISLEDELEEAVNPPVPDE